MIFETYGQQVGNAIEFLIAGANVLALICLIFGGLGIIFLSQLERRGMVKLMLYSGIVILLTGGYWVGVRHFRLHI